MARKTEFPITSVCKEDLDTAGFDISNITALQLTRIANLMENSYLENGFWHDLKEAAIRVGIPKKTKSNG